MGEWSEYFEDFPDENPANYDISGKFDPAGAAQQRAAKSKVRAETEELHATIKRMQKEGKSRALEKVRSASSELK